MQKSREEQTEKKALQYGERTMGITPIVKDMEWFVEKYSVNPEEILTKGARLELEKSY